MTGTLVNTAAVILGGAAGTLIKKGLPQRLEEALMKMLGLSVLIIGISGVLTNMLSVDAQGKLTGSGGLLMLFSLVLGTLFGELLRIEDRFDSLGKWIAKKTGQSGNFSNGLISASVIFCVGAMTIMGSFADGLRGDPSILFVKSGLDFVCALVLASSLGIGVAFAAIPVFILQGGLTLLAAQLAPLLTPELNGSLFTVGYAIVMCIGINFLGFTKIKTANLLPALVIPILYHIAAGLSV